MPKISLAGWKDPLRRPRYIVWTGAAVLVLAAVVIAALTATSTSWFCGVCHKVQDDTIISFNTSSHSKISCMACHMPVGADPVTFVLHKMKALGELYMTVTNNFELPLNPESEVALNAKEFPDEKCTQCHSENRNITPSAGIIINHKVHAEKGVRCTVCHNRVAHPENFTLTLAGNKKHENFMTMDACFRCHGLEASSAAPGNCSACHPASFKLKPENHLQAGFYPKGHAEMAREALAKVEEARKAQEGGEAAEGEKQEESAAGEAVEMKPLSQVMYCNTCHQQKFCDDCHGMQIPHPADFKTKSHPQLVKTSFKKCEMCHQPAKTSFCNNCHHGAKVDWKFDAKEPWGTQHAKAVDTKGVAVCLGACHQVKFCSDCHTQKKPFPSSHKAGDWLRKPGAEIGAHATSAKKEITACEVCHGSGGPNAAFCKKCHKLEMPHPQQFKEFHAKTGRSNPQACANCHTFKELCSNCHHTGASTTKPWVAVHGGVVNANGSASCFEKCHKKDFCVKCHTTKKVLPVSHKAKDWTKRASASVPAQHPQVFTKNAENCTYCHGDGGAKSAFCMSCHKLDMPHPTDFKASHKAEFQAKKLDKKTCNTCHTAVFCNKCHHQGYTGQKPWLKEHPSVVKAKGAEACFKCHKETYCSYCHVRLIH